MLYRFPSLRAVAAACPIRLLFPFDGLPWEQL